MNKRNHYLAPFTLIGLVIAALACGSCGSDDREHTATAPQAAVPTHTPTPVQAPQENALLDKLFEEVYFMAGGGGSYECRDEWLSEQQPEPPAVGLIHSRVVYGGTGVICLLGFPLQERIAVSFYTPDGDLLVSGDFVTDEENTAFQIHPGDVREAVGWAEAYDENSDIISIDVAWPATLPAQGYMSAISDSVYAEASFDVALSRVSILPDDWENDTNIFGPAGCFAFPAGDEVMIIGAGFEPKHSVPLGIYLGTTPGRLILSEIATTDAQGNFSVPAQIEPSDPTGFYRVLVVTTDPDGGHCFVEDALNVTECYSGPTACFRVQ